MARSEIAHNVEEAKASAERIGLPVVIRPAYTMGGAGGGFAYNMEEVQTITSRGVAASMTDSKLPDAQAGFEKGISAVTAGLAGANRILESAGMLGGLMGCSYEALMIDNDMPGMAQLVSRCGTSSAPSY